MSAKRNVRHSAVLRLKGNPVTDAAVANQLHSRVLASAVYSRALDAGTGDALEGVNLGKSAHTYVDSMIDQINPEDPLEEMLAVQALMAHSRVLHLTGLANTQKTLDSVRIVNEYADRASNTFRRLMLGLAEYRRPRGTGNTTNIGQANIAEQQVVMNGDRNATNEQGFDQGEATVPAEQPRPGVTQSLGASGEALEVINGTEDDRGEGSKPSKCLEARAEVSRCDDDSS